MAQYDKSYFYVDFSNRDELTSDEKKALEYIQRDYRPIERVELLLEYRITNKITSDDFEKMTGLPYNYEH